MGSLPRPATVTELFAPPRAWLIGRAPRQSLRSGKDQGNPGRGRKDGRRGRGGPEPRPREELVVPVGVSDVSQRERPHPNKRLKLSAPTSTGWRCHLGHRACHKDVVDFTRCGAPRRSLSAER